MKIIFKISNFINLQFYFIFIISFLIIQQKSLSKYGYDNRTVLTIIFIILMANIILYILTIIKKIEINNLLNKLESKKIDTDDNIVILAKNIEDELSYIILSLILFLLFLIFYTIYILFLIGSNVT